MNWLHWSIYMYNEWYLLTVLLIFRCLGRKYCPDCGCYFSPTHAPRHILHYFTGLLEVKHTAVFPFPTTSFCWYKLRLSFVHCITHVNDKYLEWRYIEIDFFFLYLPLIACGLRTCTEAILLSALKWQHALLRLVISERKPSPIS